MSSTQEAVPTEPIQVTSEADLDDAVSSYDVVFVDFYADWCGPCRMMEPAIERLARETDAAVLKVDVDSLQGLAARYGVEGIPNMLLFADGDAVERFVGARSADQLENAVEEYTR